MCALWPSPQAQLHFFNFKAVLGKGRDWLLGYFLLPFSVGSTSLFETPTLFEPLVLLLFRIPGICICPKAFFNFVFNIQENVFLNLREAQYFPFSLVFFG